LISGILNPSNRTQALSSTRLNPSMITSQDLRNVAAYKEARSLDAVVHDLPGMAAMKPGLFDVQHGSEPGLERVVIKAPRARHPGAPTFYGAISSRTAQAGWVEVCQPDSGLVPDPGSASKSWYNTYLYEPEVQPNVDRQFLDRYILSEDGTWLDVGQCRRTSDFIEDKIQKARQQRKLQEAIRAGVDIHPTAYRDPYSGERLISFRHELMPRAELFQRNQLDESVWQRTVDGEDPPWDLDNMRVPPWPFGKPDRNKPMSMHVYDWLDTRNIYMQRESDFHIIDMPSVYVDEESYHSWQGRDPNWDVRVPVAERCRPCHSERGPAYPPGYNHGPAGVGTPSPATPVYGSMTASQPQNVEQSLYANYSPYQA